jgi:hypothetical protein
MMIYSIEYVTTPFFTFEAIICISLFNDDQHIKTAGTAVFSSDLKHIDIYIYIYIVYVLEALGFQ